MSEAFEPAFGKAHGWQRLYVDLPGTGASPPGEPRSDAVLADLVATAQSVVGDRRFLVAGWSYGGYLAAGLARRLPERMGGLLLICTASRIRPADRDLTGVLASDAEPGWLSDVPADLHDHFTHAVGCQTAAVARRIASVLASNGPTSESYLAELQTDGWALSDEDAPTHCRAPVSIVTGRRDRVSGFAALFDAMADYEQADFLALAQAGHYLPVEQPGRFAAAVAAWLAAGRLFLDPDERAAAPPIVSAQ
jgi:pimeloyl-ACP methyl ester carboxylesterase